MSPQAFASAAPAASTEVAFIGGGNMAAALIGGLVKQGHRPECITVVEPQAAQRAHLQAGFGVRVQEAADARLGSAEMLVWAVKPQHFAEAAAPCAGLVGHALQVSVMAGVRCARLGAATAAARLVRAMPNTPALIGRGIAGVFAVPEATQADREQVERMLQATGGCVWVQSESDLDAVTALSGSGPAYVFYLLEAMLEAGQAMGLTLEQSRRLALGTLEGATALAAGSSEPPEVLRQRVTSKGGTTHAALSLLEEAGVQRRFIAAIQAAQRRAWELGQG